ncbi:MAG: hypothetical protein M3P43_15815, partial [Actinomycetota bacterium]|nr:hypothetical protein [Actinomycetota bacterium]
MSVHLQAPKPERRHIARRLMRAAFAPALIASTIGVSLATAAPAMAAPPRASLSVGDASVTEGQSGTSDLVFTATLAGRSLHTVTVDYTTMDGT